MTEDSGNAAVLAELARCREEIEHIDNSIISLLAERLSLGKRTGELKRAAGLPILDPTREAAVIRRVTASARPNGAADLDRGLGRRSRAPVAHSPVELTPRGGT